VDSKLVREWLVDVVEQIRIKAAEIDRLRAEITADERRKAALEALLDSSANPAAGLPGEQMILRSVEGEPSEPSTHPIERAGLAILAERGKPTHVSEVRAELVRRGIPIPGKGTDSNVIVYLAKSTDICRVGRGLYALRSWRIPEVPRRRPRTRRKKRKARA